MKNKISSNDILIIRNTIIWSEHDNERKRVQGQKVYVSLEREGERWNRENKNIFFRGIWLGRRKGFHAHFPRIYFTCTCKYYIIKAGPCARVYSSNDEHIYIYIGRWDADAGVATFDGTVPVGRSFEMVGFGPGSTLSPFYAFAPTHRSILSSFLLLKSPRDQPSPTHARASWIFDIQWIIII